VEHAGLISRSRRAAARLSHLEAEPLRDATRWLARYRECWKESHDRLDALLAVLHRTITLIPPFPRCSALGTLAMADAWSAEIVWWTC
jgi:hypothetical protein